MKVILFLSDFMIPLVVFYIVLYGIFNKVAIYDSFVKGAKEGFSIVADIAPTLVGLMAGVAAIRYSGFLEGAAQVLTPLGNIFKIPSPILPVIIVRLFSASAANSLVLDIFREYGTDSLTGLMTSLIMSCTETLFYTLSVYYMSVKVTKTRWTVQGALFAMAAGIGASVALAYVMAG